MKKFFLILFFCLVACQRLMNDQPRLESYGESRFFKDQEAMRLPVDHTVSSDEQKNLEKIPLQLTKALLTRGKERFEIYCMVCHSPLGDGQGIVTQRGYSPPPTYHSERLRRVPDAHIFDVITNGYGRMYRLGDRISARDRWAIVAYVRALQLSQNFKWSQLSTGEKKDLGP